MHQASPSNLRNETDGGTCDACRKTYKSNRELEMHQKIHISCKLCNIHFKQRYLLKRHIVKHWKENRHVCLDCQDVFESEKDLCNHCLKEKHEVPSEKHRISRRKAQCDVCKDWFSCKEAMLNHRNFNHFGKSYPCELCGKKFGSQGSLKIHHSQTHDPRYVKKTYTCEICSKKIMSMKYFRRHMRNHTNPSSKSDQDVKAFVCEQCGKTYPTSDKLSNHKRVHLERQFLCKHCGKKFRENFNLKLHVASHIKQDLYICVICQDVFKTDQDLQRHCCETGHEISSDSHRLVNRKRQCDICHVWLSSKQAMIDHKNFIHFGKSHVCEHCGKKFGNSQSLNVHSRTHDPNFLKKKYVCPVCSKSFLSRRNFNEHKEAHEGEKPVHLCDICGLKFSSLRTVKVHRQAKHSEEKPHTCEICKKSFIFKNLLNAHKKCHMRPVKALSCDICGKGYDSERVLRKHIQKCHVDSE